MLTRLQNEGALIHRFKPLIAMLLVAVCYLSTDANYYIGLDPREHGFQDVSSLAFASFGFLLQAVGIGFPTALTGTNDPRLMVHEPRAVGLFSLLRTPLEFGEFLAWLALPILVGSKFLILTYVLVFFICYERIVINREKLLLQRFGDRYLSWCMRTPILIPKRTGWSRSPQRFSWKRIAIASRTRFTGLLIALCLIEFGKYYSKGNLPFDRIAIEWKVLAVIAVIALALSYSSVVVRIWYKRFLMIWKYKKQIR